MADFLISISSLFSGKVYYEKDFIIYYEENQNQIQAVLEYVENHQLNDSNFRIEFDGAEINIFHVWSDQEHDSNWNLEFESDKTDSLLTKINWTKQELLELKKLLKSAGCISVQTGEPFTIGWKRSGFGMYSFNLFDKKPTAQKIDEFEAMCTHKYYRKNIMFEYGGGAIGPQCFPLKDL